jgi:hypothetical protein
MLGLLLGILAIKTAIRLIAGIYYLITGAGREVTGERVFDYGLALAWLTPLAVWMYIASYSFQSIVETKGSDVDHLMSGLKAIHNSFRWIIALVLLAVVAAVGVLVLHLAKVI